MRYLRMLSNSVVAAIVATCYVLALVLQLNPALSVAPLALGRLASTVGVFYAVHLSVIFYVLLVVRQLFARELFSPAWLSIRVLTWLVASAALAGALLMWTNLQTFTLVLEPETARLMADGAAALVASAAIFVVSALLRTHFAPAGRLVWALLFASISAASIAVLLALRGPGLPPLLPARSIDMALTLAADRSTRLTIVGIDAGSLDFIASATADGRLPNFGRILDAGAVMHLATLRPTSTDAVWAAVATGKLPQKNGVRSAATYHLAGGGEPIQLLPDYCFSHALVRFGFLAEEAHTSTSLRTRTVWSILSSFGISVGVIGWPLTQPAPAVRGYLVSDTYHRIALTPSGIDEASSVYPPDLQAQILPVLDTIQPEGANPLPEESQPIEAGRIDRVYDRIGQELGTTRPAQVTFVRYRSLDPIGHYFLRYAMPLEFGDVSEDERRRFGSVLEQHYAVIDEALGRAIAALGPNDLLLVVSGYGIQPLTLAKRLLERLIGDPDLSGTHEGAPDGFLIAFGGPVAPARLPARASVVDVLPTVLYFLGLPIGRDMDGYARTDLFQRSFTADRPITFIPTYER